MASEVVRKPSSLIWKTLNEDPTKMAVLQAIVSCRLRLRHDGLFGTHMICALTQTRISVCSFRSYSLKLEEVHY